MLKQEGGEIIYGPYQIVPEHDYFRLIINPNQPDKRFDVAISFINSLYAKVIVLGENQQPVEFAPPNQAPKHPSNEIKLFRLGDLL